AVRPGHPDRRRHLDPRLPGSFRLDDLRRGPRPVHRPLRPRGRSERPARAVGERHPGAHPLARRDLGPAPARRQRRAGRPRLADRVAGRPLRPQPLILFGYGSVRMTDESAHDRRELMLPYEHPYRRFIGAAFRHQLELRTATALAGVLWLTAVIAGLAGAG